jgi:hypothetical protein
VIKVGIYLGYCDPILATGYRLVSIWGIVILALPRDKGWYLFEEDHNTPNRYQYLTSGKDRITIPQIDTNLYHVARIGSQYPK